MLKYFTPLIIVLFLGASNRTEHKLDYLQLAPSERERFDRRLGNSLYLYGPMVDKPWEQITTASIGRTGQYDMYRVATVYAQFCAVDIGKYFEIRCKPHDTVTNYNVVYDKFSTIIVIDLEYPLRYYDDGHYTGYMIDIEFVPREGLNPESYTHTILNACAWTNYNLYIQPGIRRISKGKE